MARCMFPKPDSIVDSQPMSTLQIEIDFNEVLAPVAPGTYEVAPWPAAISAYVSTASSYDEATTGSLTFELFDANQVRGTGTLDLESGGTLTFSFDIDIVITYDMSMD